MIACAAAFVENSLGLEMPPNCRQGCRGFYFQACDRNITEREREKSRRGPEIAETRETQSQESPTHLHFSVLRNFKSLRPHKTDGNIFPIKI